VTDRDAERASLCAAARQKGVAIDEFTFPDDRQVILDELRFHYLDWRGPSDRVIVFLHGFALTAHTWDLVCLALRRDYRCIALDMRGHGDSEWHPGLEYGIGAMAGDVERLIDALALERPILVGMSMGGVVALRYAISRSIRLGALVVVEAGAAPRADGVARMRAFVEQEHEHDSIEDFVAQAMRFNSRRDPEILRESLRHNLRRQWNGRWTWKYDRRHLGVIPGEHHLRSLEAIAAESGAIACPTLVVRGALSDLFGEQDLATVAGRIGGARSATVAQAGHNVQGDDPAGFVAVLQDFLRSIGS
jgi:pimeloyl-ACP methyl ester carboxylesterase